MCFETPVNFQNYKYISNPKTYLNDLSVGNVRNMFAKDRIIFKPSRLRKHLGSKG